MSDLPPLDSTVLPSGVRARFVDGINGLRMHILEAGFESPGRPAVLLLHGFPELAYSWRNIIVPLAEAGFMSSRRTSAAMAAPPAGIPITTAISPRSIC
jgi:pimeloyl-ACP methyl ester carboxylesterase